MAEIIILTETIYQGNRVGEGLCQVYGGYNIKGICKKIYHGSSFCKDMVSTPPWCYLTNKLAKIRVVFDVNVDCKGRCINRKLLSGPDLTNKIAGVLLRFGEEQVLVIGEISGIDSWVQPRLNLGFTWILKPANLDEPSEQVAQVRARF